MKENEQIEDWTEEDHQLREHLISASCVVSEPIKHTLARRAVEVHRQCARLDSIKDRTGEQEKALASAHKNYMAFLSRLGVADKTPEKRKRKL